VLIVNREFVRRYFPDRDPIGRVIAFNGTKTTIVGVVGDVKLRSVRTEGFDPFMYQPVAQACDRDMTLFLRTSGDPRQWADAARRAIWQIDPTQPILELQTMDHYILESMFVERSCMFLMAAMAGLALVVGLVGLYAVMSSAVNERRSEIGIRLALGAGRKDILRLVLGQGLILTGVGLAIGVAISLAVSRLMGSLLYGISSWDRATFLLVPLLLLAVALLACYVPARRAARVQPMEVLRYE
jgi:putative ABC transport system permease protein